MNLGLGGLGFLLFGDSSESNQKSGQRQARKANGQPEHFFEMDVSVIDHLKLYFFERSPDLVFVG
jgi:hypothetical protein